MCTVYCTVAADVWCSCGALLAAEPKRMVNLGQLAPGWRWLITGKHGGKKLRAIEQRSTPTWLLKGRHSFTINTKLNI